MKKEKIKKTVMVIDDDTSVLKALGIVLEELGYNVNLYEDGKKAFVDLTHNPPNVLLLDLIMPNMDGEEILKKLKRDKKLKNLPVILLSASNTIEDIASSYNVRGFIRKPFDINKLYNLVYSCENSFNCLT